MMYHISSRSLATTRGESLMHDTCGMYSAAGGHGGPDTSRLEKGGKRRDHDTVRYRTVLLARP